MSMTSTRGLQGIPSGLRGGGSDQKEPLSKAMLLPVQKATQCPPNKYTQSMLYIRYDSLSAQSLALPWAFKEASRRWRPRALDSPLGTCFASYALMNLSLLHSPCPHCDTEMHLPWGMSGQQLRSQSSELEFMGVLPLGPVILSLSLS